MERFTLDLENLIKEKASELYLDVCKEIVETNGLSNKAKEICLKLCDMNIEREEKKDPLTNLASTWRTIKEELSKKLN